MFQPLFAARILILNDFPSHLRMHEKGTVSFAAVGARFTVQQSIVLKREFPQHLIVAR